MTDAGNGEKKQLDDIAAAARRLCTQRISKVLQDNQGAGADFKITWVYPTLCTLKLDIAWNFNLVNENPYASPNEQYFGTDVRAFEQACQAAANYALNELAPKREFVNYRHQLASRDLKQALSGSALPVKVYDFNSMSVDVKCPECNGRGTITCGRCHGSGRITCPDCDGSGAVLIGQDPQYDSKGNFAGSSPVYGTCTTCNGTGQARCPSCGGHGEYTCSTCNGRGLMVQRRKFFLGAAPKKLVRLPGAGQAEGIMQRCLAPCTPADLSAFFPLKYVSSGDFDDLTLNNGQVVKNPRVWTQSYQSTEPFACAALTFTVNGQSFEDAYIYNERPIGMPPVVDQLLADDLNTLEQGLKSPEPQKRLQLCEEAAKTAAGRACLDGLKAGQNTDTIKAQFYSACSFCVSKSFADKYVNTFAQLLQQAASAHPLMYLWKRLLYLFAGVFFLISLAALALSDAPGSMSFTLMKFGVPLGMLLSIPCFVFLTRKERGEFSHLRPFVGQLQPGQYRPHYRFFLLMLAALVVAELAAELVSKFLP